MTASSERRQQLNKAANFVVFYGHGQCNLLSGYNIAIVEPAGQDGRSVKELHESGVLVIAYVSVTEVPDYDPLKTLLRDTDYLTVNGKVIANEAYHTLLADLRSRNWISLLLHRIGGYLRQSGYDGIFLDTISNVEWPVLPAGVRAEQQRAALELVKRIRKLHPNCLLIQNNGLETLCADTAPYLDAICWENPDFVNPETYSWHESVKLKLKQLVADYGIRVLLLQETGSTSKRALKSAVSWAEREHYLHYLSPNHYLEVKETMDSIE